MSEINYLESIPNEIIVEIFLYTRVDDLLKLCSVSKMIKNIIVETTWGNVFVKKISLKSFDKIFQIITTLNFNRYHIVARTVLTEELVKLDYYRLKHRIKKFITVYDRKSRQINIFNVNSNKQIKSIYKPNYFRYNIFAVENITESELNSIVNYFKNPNRECVLSSLPNCNIQITKLEEIIKKTNYNNQSYLDRHYLNLHGYKLCYLLPNIYDKQYCNFSHTDFDNSNIDIISNCEFIDLSYGKISSSNLWRLKKCKTLILSGCPNISFLDYRLGSYLEELDISNCENVSNCTIKDLRKLKKINISGCTNITIDGLYNLSSCREIVLSNSNIEAGIDISVLKTFISNVIVE